MADKIYSDIEKMKIAKLKVPDLKRELKARNLKTAGNKEELIERLMKAMEKDASGNKSESNAGKNNSDASADGDSMYEEHKELFDEDEVLNDFEIEEEVGHIKNIDLEITDKSFDVDDVNTSSNTSNNSMKRKKIELDSPSKEVKSAKKIILNREPSIDIKEDTRDELKSVDSTNGSPTDEKKVIKLSEINAKDRLEMRAKKFGVSLSVDAKKEVRAERFGQITNSTTTTGKTKITLNTAPASVELLKKRAERFGTVSTQLKKVETDEKLEKRKQRFGGSITPAVSTNGSSINNDQKAKRLERFKLK